MIFMRTWLWIIPIFGTGIGVGFLVGERYGRQREIEKQEEIRNEEQKRKEKEAEKASEGNKGPHPIRDEVAQAQEAVKEYAPDEDFDLDKQAKEMEEYLSSEPFPGQDDDPPKKKAFDPDIKIVGEQLWEENTEYEPNDLRYFEEDGVFVDESDDRVTDPEDHIGQEAVSQFENYPTLDILYVTNDWTNEIYRITRVHDSYGRAILGMDEDFEYYPGM